MKWTKIDRCPNCDEHNTEIEELWTDDGEFFRVVCNDCQMAGPAAKAGRTGRAKAIKAWNFLPHRP